jgi:glycosyltransferase involved in cell wall biosynthesis
MRVEPASRAVRDGRVRVLSVFPSLDPAGGGIQSGGINMVLASRRAGVDHVVSCTEVPSSRARAEQLYRRLEDLGIEVTTFAPIQRPASLAERWSIAPSQVPWILRHVGEFDVVHVHGVWNIGALAGLAATRLRHVPLVVTPHESMTDNDIDKSRSRARRSQKLFLKSLYMRWTDLFIVTSQLETDESLPPAAPHETIAYPLSDSREPAAELQTRGDQRELRVGYLGRIAAKKNVILLVEAMALLPEHVRLLIAGSGPDEVLGPARRRAEELGLGERIEWLGFVPPDDRERFLSSIDVLAMPSQFESFGMAAAEAMLAGVPLLVSERTGISEVLTRQGGGVVVKVSAEAVADALLELDRNRDQLTGLGADAQRAIQEELDYDRLGERLRQAYLHVISAPPETIAGVRDAPLRTA